MKKNIITFFLCIIVLTGCSSSKKVENIEREQIIGTLYNVSESAVSYPDIPSLTKNSEIIIYGEVVQTESVTPENGIARTIEEVEVLENFKGQFKKGDVIRVGSDNGAV